MSTCLRLRLNSFRLSLTPFDLAQRERPPGARKELRVVTYSYPDDLDFTRTRCYNQGARKDGDVNCLAQLNIIGRAWPFIEALYRYRSTLAPPEVHWALLVAFTSSHIFPYTLLYSLHFPCQEARRLGRRSRRPFASFIIATASFNFQQGGELNEAYKIPL